MVFEEGTNSGPLFLSDRVYCSFVMPVRQVIWLMNLLKEHCSDKGEAVTLMVDNISVINLAKNLIAHGRRKHIEMRFYYLKKLVSEGRLRLGYCRSEDQMVDLLT